MHQAKKKSIMDVLIEALRRETEAFNYYYKASIKAPYPETRSLLIQLAEEERKHRLFITKELQRIEKLMVRGTGDSFIDTQEIRYPVPTEVTFKRLETSPGVDLAAASFPVEFLGGDCLETVKLDRKRKSPALGVFLYDVMGHGLEATQIMSVAKKTYGMLREAWVQRQNLVDLNQPRQVMMELNRRLIDNCQDSRSFVSAFYGVVDPDGKTFTYTSAGHEPPILVKTEGNYVHLNETELLLGIERNAEYSEVRIPIDNGDVFALFSDGITEAGIPGENMFERNRLRLVIQKVREASASEIIHHIIDALRNFVGEEPMTDEFTLAVMKVKS